MKVHVSVGLTNPPLCSFAHKWMSRITLMMSWFTAFMGLFQLTEDPAKLAIYGIPLLVLLFPTFM